MDLWTEFLGLLSQVVTPLWDTLLQYIPLLLLILLAVWLLMQVRVWRRNAPLNRPRLVKPVASGQMPPGIHLPSPSIWPFIAPIGLFLIFLGVVLGQENGPNLAIVGLGVAIGAIAAVGWLRDAGREYAATDAGDHDLLLVAETGGLEPPESPIPEGIHLPPPSPWPFLAPIGLFFVFLGLALGPVLIIGGAVMAIIAAIGWLRDAGREYHEVEDGAHTDPGARDPERVFPKALVPVYATVGAVAVLLTLGPWLLALLPQTVVAEDQGPPSTTTPYLSASSAVSFVSSGEIVVPAETPFTITFENKQAGVPHNVWIVAGPPPAEPLFQGEDVTGPATVEYAVTPIGAGEYPFICSIHPPMKGTLIVR